MKLTEAKKKKVRKWVKEWRSILNLDDWYIDIYWQVLDEDSPKKHCAAWVERDGQYLRAQIYINTEAFLKTWKDFDEERVKGYIIHELVHVFLNDYDEMVESIWKTECEHDQVRERTTEKLTWILINLQNNHQ